MFIVLFFLLMIQRVTELYLAKRNEKWLLNRGGIEYGRKHYPFIVALHIFFLFSLLLEVLFLNKELTDIWLLIIPLLAISQVIRYWSVFSLGKYWNTKIIIIPDESVVLKGPYQFMRHPNYLVVAVEILLIPLLFHAYFTSLLFTILNVLIMTIRIPAEESALLANTSNYDQTFSLRLRFATKK